MNALKKVSFAIVLAAASAGLAPAWAVGPGVVLGQLKSNVTVDHVTQKNRASLGYAKQELNLGSVNGGKVVGNLELNVHVKGVHQSNRAILGYSNQTTSIGSVK